MYKLGLVSVSFRNLDPKQIITLVKNAGLSCIEWGSDVHAPAEDTARLLEIAKLQKENGIYCSSYGTYFKIGQNDPDEIRRYITAAKILGTDILRVWCGTKGSAQYTKAELEEVYGQCRQIADIAKSEGVVICLECHIKTLTDDVLSTLSLLKHVDSDSFCMYWQPNQFKSFEQNLDYAKAIADKTKHIHVFNWREKEKFPLCKAEDTWKKYLSAFSGERTLLLEFMPDNDPASLVTEAAALKEITGGI